MIKYLIFTSTLHPKSDINNNTMTFPVSAPYFIFQNRVEPTLTCKKKVLRMRAARRFHGSSTHGSQCSRKIPYQVVLSAACLLRAREMNRTGKMQSRTQAENQIKCAEYEEEKDIYSTTVNVVLKATYFNICDFYERNLNIGLWNGQLLRAVQAGVVGQKKRSLQWPRQ